MTAKDFYNECLESAANGSLDYNRMKNAHYQYVISHCYHPKKIWCYDAHYGKKILRSVPCGNCYHCRLTKINEWVTRLYAHLEHYKYCYFVTLTYRSFENKMNDFDKFLFDYLCGAIWHYDTLNEFHRPCYSPSVLCKKHYQDFLKRLRFNTKNDDITFFGCGEYGEKWSRPHFHFIIFSKSHIDKSEFNRAWSLQLSNSGGFVHKSKNDKVSISCLFGRVQVDDLVLNGTIGNKSVLVDGRSMSAKKCFAYVAKYCGKKKFSSKRLQLIYNEYKSNLIEYESEKFFNEDLSFSFDQFSKPFKPFLSCSRGTPIGSLFVKMHVEQMADGIFPVPQIQKDDSSGASSFIVPSYFRRKAAESLYSLRRVSSSGCISKGNLPALAFLLARECRSDLSVKIGNLIKQDTAKSTFPFIPSSQVKDLNSLLNSPDVFVDVSSKSRFLLVAPSHYNLVRRGYGMGIKYDIPYTPIEVREYKYSRSLKSYEHIFTHSLESWCLHYLSSMPDDFVNYLNAEKLTKQSESYLQLIDDFYTLYDKVDDLHTMVPFVEKLNDDFLHQKDIINLQFKNL